MMNIPAGTPLFDASGKRFAVALVDMGVSYPAHFQRNAWAHPDGRVVDVMPARGGDRAEGAIVSQLNRLMQAWKVV